MTPLQAELHQAHKARQQRFAAAAERHTWNKKARSEAKAVSVEAPVVETPKAPEKPDPIKTMPSIAQPAKPLWFNVVDDGPLPTLENITRVVAQKYGCKVSDIKSARRTAQVVRPRHIVFYLAKILTEKSFPQIGRFIGGRDHSTALHGYRQIAHLITMDSALAQKIETLIGKFAKVPE